MEITKLIVIRLKTKNYPKSPFHLYHCAWRYVGVLDSKHMRVLSVTKYLVQPYLE